ncbi:MAG: M1 family metallopeptidase [Ignavibacteriales bacterium]|nr:M1 family metallopeptidase [Ignavibacteriales bacterium]
MKKTFFFFISLSSFIYAQFGSQDSGGKLIPEQKCYDVKFYDINLTVDPAEKVIGGFTTITAAALSDLQTIVIDLDNTMAINELTRISPNGNETEIPFKHENGKIHITFSAEIKQGETFSVKISYAGAPRVAKRPPWDDGFIWSKTKDGTDWVTLTCQGGGADIWYPCKDHPSDEADSVATHFTVPSNLVCIGSGKLRTSVDNKNGTKTWNWFSSNPINNYSVMFYLGDYIPIEYDYTSITGEKIPFTVWVLPESLEKAKAHAPQFIQHMKINEELVGPYPFRNDKYSVVESPHLGMEHQTAIAYGAGWKNHKDFPFDWLHHHEFSHEWWGNLVTVSDWSDFWIHEGTGTYMQPLYLEKVFGKEMYLGYLKSIKRFANKEPIAPRGEKTSGESYTLDIYYKGAWVLHTLRYYLGDETFFKVFRRWAYPTEAMEKIKTGAQCRNSTTDEFLQMAEKISGKKLDWFWEVYMRQASLPKLHYKKEQNKIVLWWETENNISFPLPVEVKIAGEVKSLDMIGGKGEFALTQDEEFTIDANERLLMELIKD